MLHAAEFHGDIADGLNIDRAPHGADGRQIVLDVVHPRQAQFIFVDDLRSFAVDRRVQDPVFAEESACAHRAPDGEFKQAPANIGGKGCGKLVVNAEHRARKRVLMQHNVALGIDILLHVPMHVEMIRADVRHNRDAGAFTHGNQLKARQFRNGKVIIADIAQDRHQRTPDVAADMRAAAPFL